MDDRRTQGGGMQPPRPDWNKAADFYSQFALSEIEDTRSYLEVLGIGQDDTVLDVCCGPGRMSVAAAERGAHVVGIDWAEKMLARAWENAEEFGVAELCDFRLMDWNHVLPGQNLERADVVIASRCSAIMDVEKLSSLAKRTVGVQIFADAPSIPQLIDILFSGCGEPMQPQRPGPQNDPSPQGGPVPPFEQKDSKRSGPYFTIFEKAYQAGFDPNVRIFPERFRKEFPTLDDAVAWVARLSPQRAEGNLERLRSNVETFCTPSQTGVEFRIATKAAIIWWDVKNRLLPAW